MHSRHSLWQVDIDAVIARLEEMHTAPLPPWKADRIAHALRAARSRRPARP